MRARAGFANSSRTSIAPSGSVHARYMNIGAMPVRTSKVLKVSQIAAVVASAITGGRRFSVSHAASASTSGRW